MSAPVLLQRVARRATARFRPLPDFVMIGTMRSASTSLFDLLASHPEVAASSRKEVHYADLHADRGEHWYRAFFDLRSGSKRVGESTPSYLAHPAAPANLSAIVPHARLVVVLRDPVARAISHHAYRTTLGYEHRPLREAVADEISLEADGFETLTADISAVKDMPYLASGRYAEQLGRWFDHFDQEQFLILDYVDVIADSVATYRRICAFLGLTDAAAALPQTNSSPGGDADEALVARLTEYFAGPDERLRTLLGRSLSWMTPLEAPIDLRDRDEPVILPLRTESHQS